MPISPVSDIVKRFFIGALRTVCHPLILLGTVRPVRPAQSLSRYIQVFAPGSHSPGVTSGGSKPGRFSISPCDKSFVSRSVFRRSPITILLTLLVRQRLLHKIFPSACCSRSSFCWRLRSFCLNRVTTSGIENRIRLRCEVEGSNAAIKTSSAKSRLAVN